VKFEIITDGENAKEHRKKGEIMNQREFFPMINGVGGNYPQQIGKVVGRIIM